MIQKRKKKINQIHKEIVKEEEIINKSQKQEKMQKKTKMQKIA